MTSKEVIKIHKKYAKNEKFFELVYTHCLIIWDIAQEIVSSRSIDVDLEKLKIGSLLHDIGVYALYDSKGKELEPYAKHGILGEEILMREGFNKDIYSIAACHIGVGLTKQDVLSQKLPLPARDYLPNDIEGWMIIYADKFHSKTTPPFFTSAAWYLNYVGQFGEDKKLRFLKLIEEFGEPDLKNLSKKYGHAIR